MHKPESAITIEPGMMRKIFGLKRVLKADDTGLIALGVDNVYYGYQLYNDLFIEYKNSRVILRYDEENLDEVSIYSFPHDNFISSMKKIIVWTKDKPEVYYRHIGKLKKTVRMIYDSRDADDALLDKSPKRGASLSKLLTNKTYQA